MSRWPQSLIDAAAFERDRRESAYPAVVRDRRMTEADATADFQAWHAIHDWLATDAVPTWFTGEHGVGDGWARMEEAAAKALATIQAKRKPGDDPDLELRHARLFAIHHAVARQRAWLDEANRLLRGRAQLLAPAA